MSGTDGLTDREAIRFLARRQAGLSFPPPTPEDLAVWDAIAKAGCEAEAIAVRDFLNRCASPPVSSVPIKAAIEAAVAVWYGEDAAETSAEHTAPSSSPAVPAPEQRDTLEALLGTALTAECFEHPGAMEAHDGPHYWEVTDANVQEIADFLIARGVRVGSLEPPRTR